VDETTSARSAWVAIAAQYRSTALARRVQLKRELATLQRGGSESLLAYFDRGRRLAIDLKICGGNNGSDCLYFSIISGLPPSFKNTVQCLTLTESPALP